jgi:hypothetical protein
MNEFAVVGYFIQPVRVWVEAETAGEAYDIGQERLKDGEGVVMYGSWADEFTVYDSDGDEVPEHELYELGD